MTALQEIENKAFTLSLPERCQLIHDLIVTMNGETQYDDDFEQDIQTRVKRIKSGKAVGIPVGDAFSKIRKNKNRRG